MKRKIVANELSQSNQNDVVIRKVNSEDESNINSIYNEANISGLNSFIEKLVGSTFWLWSAVFITIVVGLLIPKMRSLLYLGYLMAFFVAIIAYFPFVFYTLSSTFGNDFKNGVVDYYSEEDRVMLIAEVNNTVVGMVGIKPANVKQRSHFKGLRKEGDAELSRMAISKIARGRGVSKHLLTAAKAYCEENGFKRMILTTSTAQEVACCHLYPSFGFKEDKRVNVLLYGGIIDSVFFSYTLDSKDK